jgi:hypothetical protein
VYSMYRLIEPPPSNAARASCKPLVNTSKQSAAVGGPDKPPPSNADDTRPCNFLVLLSTTQAAPQTVLERR